MPVRRAGDVNRHVYRDETTIRRLIGETREAVTKEQAAAKSLAAASKA